MYFGKTKQSDQSGRVPPNQNVTTSFPVLHTGNVPYYEDMAKWNLQVYGLVDHPMLLSFEDVKAFPQYESKMTSIASLAGQGLIMYGKACGLVI